jgi:hypothetical protein
MDPARALASLLLLAVASSAQVGDGANGEQDEAAAESALADRPLPQRVDFRCRTRGPGATPDQLSFYTRASWCRADGQEFYLVTERDPGESHWADYAAAYAHLASKGTPWSATVGDLRPGWASGLLLGRTAGLTGGSLPHPPRDSDIVGSRSAGENQSLRGLALRWQRSRLTVVTVVGQARRDARLDTMGRVISLPESGSHMTPTELAGQDQLGVETVAGRLVLTFGTWRLGASGQGLSFSRPVDLRRGGRLPYAFHGSSIGLVAADIDGRVGRLDLRAEAAADRRGHRSRLGGLRLDLGRIRARLVARWHDPGFYAPFGTGAANERGLQMVLEGHGWSAYAGRQRRPAPTLTFPSPANSATCGSSTRTRLPGGLLLQTRYYAERQPRLVSGSALSERAWRLAVDLEKGGRPSPVRRGSPAGSPRCRRGRARCRQHGHPAVLAPAGLSVRCGHRGPRHRVPDRRVRRTAVRGRV